MKIQDRYLEALKLSGEWLTVAEWAQQVAELYPDLLEKAEIEAENQKRDTTGLREIAARISSSLAKGTFQHFVEEDRSFKPRKLIYLDELQQACHMEEDLEEDTAPLKRSEIIKRDTQGLNGFELYRVEEFENIAKSLKRYFSLDFEVDHAHALLNKDLPGFHHPDNLQLLLKQHNAKKSSSNWQRFTFEEQADYIRAAIRLQSFVANRFEEEIESGVLESLIDRLHFVYLSQS